MELPSEIHAILFDLDGTLIQLPNMIDFFDTILVQTLKDHKARIPVKADRLAVWPVGVHT